MIAAIREWGSSGLGLWTRRAVFLSPCLQGETERGLLGPAASVMVRFSSLQSRLLT